MKEIDRVPTGIGGLDPLIGGGLPRGSLILLAGNPGTGKTVFGVQFICGGSSEYGEAGVYVSFAESRGTLIGNARRHIGCDLEALEGEGRLQILDLATMREEGLSTVLEMILDAIRSLGAKRLVIDSFSAMAQAFEEPIDPRIVLHTILGKMTRQMGCTTILTVEVPTGREEIGVSVEEFVADGVLILRRLRLDGRDLREMEIAKMRGTEIRQSRYVFTLHGGFHVFAPFVATRPEEAKLFKPTPDPDGYFLTGNPRLDEILGGGYRRGNRILIEVGEGVPAEAYRLLGDPTIWNFLAQGRGCVIFPTEGVDAEIIREGRAPYVGEDVWERFMRVYERRAVERPETRPYVIQYTGESYEDDVDLRVRARRDLEDGTGQPSLAIFGLDAYENLYGVENTLSRTGTSVAETAALGNLDMVVAKPGCHEKVLQQQRNVSAYHLVLSSIDRAVLMHGVRPATGLYCLEHDISKGHPEARLTPIV
ncbi:MAG: ATPase domain-containing protein [Candidatus Bathyarchaeia archaeon]